MAGRLEQAGRRALSRLIAFLLPADEGDPGVFAARPPRRVLVVRQDDRIGNLVLLTPLLQAIGMIWPEARSDVLISPRFSALYDGLPFVYEVVHFDKQAILHNPLRFFGLIRDLRRREYDVVFDASHPHSFSLTGAGLAYFTGAPVRVAYDRGDAAHFANLLVEPLQAEHHESDLLRNLLRPFADRIPDPPTRLVVTPAETRAAAALLQKAGVGDEEVVVGIHVGGRALKKWPVDRWIEVVAEILRVFRVRPVILCGPAEAEEAVRLTRRFAEEVPLFDALDLRGMTALIGRCDFFLSPDTGPMHVAAALGVPTVAVFLQDNFTRYGPAGLIHRVVRTTPEEGASDVLLAFADVVRERYPEEGRGEGGDADPE